jgi:hypothetical protein
MRPAGLNILSFTIGGFVIFVAAVSSPLIILSYCFLMLVLASESLDEYWPAPLGLAIIGIVPLLAHIEEDCRAASR